MALAYADVVPSSQLRAQLLIALIPVSAATGDREDVRSLADTALSLARSLENEHARGHVMSQLAEAEETDLGRVSAATALVAVEDWGKLDLDTLGRHWPEALLGISDEILAGSAPS